MEEKTAKAIFLFQELFLLEKTVFALLSFCSILNHSDKILLVTLPLQQRQSARWFEKILMVLWYFINDNNTRMFIFWCSNQFLLLNIFPSFVLQIILLINSISFSFGIRALNLLPAFIFSRFSSYFLSILWML